MAARKWNEKTRERILKAIRAGNYFRSACAYAGISHETFYRWLRRGRNAKSGEYRAFFEAVKEAEAAAEVAVVAVWKSAIPKDWRAARDFLARRWPERWSASRPVELEDDELGDPSEATSRPTLTLSLDNFLRRGAS